MPLPSRRPVSSLFRPTRLAVSALVALALAFAAPTAVRAQHHAHGEAAPSRPAAAPRVKHPTPRPGITAEGVLPDEAVEERAREAYQKARLVPQVLDGIHCHCDCHRRHPELHSLLDCFKSQMAARCIICLGAAELAADLHGQGKSLEEIRKAIDKQYGR